MDGFPSVGLRMMFYYHNKAELADVLPLSPFIPHFHNPHADFPRTGSCEYRTGLEREEVLPGSTVGCPVGFQEVNVKLYSFAILDQEIKPLVVLALCMQTARGGDEICVCQSQQEISYLYSTLIFHTLESRKLCLPQAVEPSRH